MFTLIMSFDLGSVQRKISCIFKVAVLPNTSSTKRDNQTYSVIATDKLRENVSVALTCTQDPVCSRDVHHLRFVATEKLDGTCVLISEYCDKPWLWARLDRKPNKSAEKRFRKFQSEHPESLIGDVVHFEWDIEKDFKDVPATWIPAENSVTKEGTLRPDTNGHIPGWMPVDQKLKQYCWHLSVVDLNVGVGLVLQRKSNILEISQQSLADLSGSTLELIGTNVNGNPYKLGSKLKPLHLLVRHGIIPVDNLPHANFTNFRDWFQGPDGGVEGIVWHFENGEMYKLHRHHMGLPWPVADLKMLSMPVFVNVPKDIQETYSSQLLSDILRFSGQTFDSLEQLKLD